MMTETMTETVAEQIAIAILQGFRRSQIDALAQKLAPGITSRAIDAAYAAAVERWVADAATADGDLYALHVARREHLYRRAMAEGDLALAHKVLVDQAKLQQQYRTEQREAERKDKESALAEKIRAKRPVLTAVGGR